MEPKNLKQWSEDKQMRKDHYEELVKYMNHNDKVLFAKKRIKEFLKWNEQQKDINEITVSFSGGKDSTVLLDLVMKVHKEIDCKIPIVMVYATEITFPSTLKFIKETNLRYQQLYPNRLKNIEIVYPKKTWNEILNQNGYPIFSKQISTLINRIKRAKTKNSLCKWFFNIDKDITHTAKYKLSYHRLFLLDDNMLINWPNLDNNDELKQYFKKYEGLYFFSEKCCDFIKGNLKHDKRPSFIGVMAQESEMRKRSWIDYGCNIYEKNKLKSRPLSIWTANDVWRYIKDNKLEINPAYGFDQNIALDKQLLRFERLGCISCPYGSNIEQLIIDRLKKINKEQDRNYKTLNRFEILKQDYPNLYLSQVINNGMYKILIDMDIKINNDPLFMQLYNLRRKQINDWYSDKNFRNNLLSVMCQIENYKDYKQKGSKYIWNYKLSEFDQALTSFNLQKTKLSEITKIRQQVKKQFSINLNNKID